MHRERVDGKVLRATVHVTLKDKNGNEKANVSITPKSGSTWSVNLPAGVEVAEGDKVTAYQELNGNKSPEVTADAKSSLASGNKDKLKMPTGEIWIEQTSSNIISDDEQAEAVKMLKDANTEIEGDIKSVKFSIDGTEHAYYEVTYTDNSTSGKIEATDLKIKQVTETSMGADLDSITVVDNVIKGKLTGEGPFTDIKVQLILKVSGFDKSKFCDKKCTLDKNSSKPVDAVVDTTTGKFTYTLTGTEKIELDQVVGVTVKEKNKFISCSTTETVALKTPSKTEVRDPRTLTDEDKKAIDKAIRDANTVKGISKLPDWTANNIPAYIEFDKYGNARIISPTNVNGDWENYTEFIPNKKADGSLDVKDETEVITIKAEDLILNKAPDAPSVVEDENNTKITITPNLKLDSDIKEITISYTDKDGNLKTATAKKDSNDKWSTTDTNISINEDTAVIAISRSVLKGASDVSATVKDNGGLTKEETEQTAIGTTKVSADVKFDANEGTGTMDMKFVKINNEYALPQNGFTAPTNKEFKAWEVNGKEYAEGTLLSISGNTTVKAVWKDIEVKISYNGNGGSGTMTGTTVKKGSKYTLLANAFTAPDDTQEFDTWEVDGKKVAAGTEITVSKDTVIKALWKKIQVKVTYDANGGSGNMTGAQVDKGSKYTILPNSFTAPDDTQEFKAWEVDGQEVAPNTEITVNKDTTVKAIWKKIQVKVSYDANDGKGTMEAKTLDKGSKYTLLANGFTAPENKEFDGWMVGNEKKAVGDTITVDRDTVVKAIWKDIMVDVTFDKGEGSGEMAKVSVKKGGQYKLPDSKFTAPKNQKFIGWKVGDGTEVKAVGTEITVADNTKLTAVYQDIEHKVNFNGTEGSGKMDEKVVKQGDEYTLPENGFTAPKNKKFVGWKVGNEDKKPGDKITVNADTEVKAVWEDIMHKVTFNGNGGTGSMGEKSVKQGSKYTLPANGFTAPDKKQFKGWKIGDTEYAVGDEITVSGDTTVTAVWENAPKPNPEPNPGDTPGTNPEPNPGYYPDPTPNPTPNPNKPDNNKDNKKDEPKKPDTPTPPQPGPGKEELPVNPKPDGTQEITPDPEKTDEVEVTVTPDGKDPEKVKVEKDKDGNWITDRPDILKVDPKTGKITVAKGVKDVRAIATLKLERGFHERYLYGYVDDTVRPEGFITRCEAAALIARLANLDMTNADKPNFPDTPSAWYNTAINAVVAKNLMFADANGNFRPQEPITRGEFARALYYIDRHNDEIAPFEDIKGHIYEAAINQAYGNGLINGYLDGTFKPDAPIQRAEATKILNKYANRGVDSDGLSLVRQDLIHFTDIDESHWAYYEIMEAANTHEYERVVSTLYETWLKIVYDTKMK